MKTNPAIEAVKNPLAPQNAIEENQQIDKLYWYNKIDKALRYIEAIEQQRKVKKNKAINTIAVKYMLNIFQYAPLSILGDRALMSVATQENLISYSKLPPVLQNDKEFALEFLKKGYGWGLSKEVLLHEEVFFAALRKSPLSYREIYYSEKLLKKYATEDMSIRLLKEVNANLFECFAPSLKNNLTIAACALEQNPANVKYMLQKVSKKVITTPALATSVLVKSIEFACKIPKKIFKDKNFVITWLSKHPSLLKYVHPHLLKDETVLVLAASSRDFLSVVGEEYKKRADLMKIYLGNFPCDYKSVAAYIDPIPLLVSGVKGSTYLYQRLPAELQAHPHLIYAVLTHDSYFSLNSVGKSSNILQILPLPVIQEILALKYATFNATGVQAPSDLQFFRNHYSNLYLQDTLKNTLPNPKVKI